MSSQQAPLEQQTTQKDPLPNIQIALVHDLKSFQRCVDLQVAVWGYSDGDVIPRRMFLVADRIGGQVLAAFDGDTMAGFAMALPAYRDGMAYLHSHMLAVLPKYRNLGLGRRLKLAQRDDAIARGIELMEWTFDPTEIKNAYLNIERLGAICRRYYPNFYGPSSSPLQGGLPTDRLYAEWWLRSPRVQRHLNVSDEEPTKIAQEIVVPHQLYEWKREPATRQFALDVQTANREALQAAFSRGLNVTGYRREPNGDGHFLLTVPDLIDIAPPKGNSPQLT